jgi:hypothetical protein
MRDKQLIALDQQLLTRSNSGSLHNGSLSLLLLAVYSNPPATVKIEKCSTKFPKHELRVSSSHLLDIHQM